MTPSRPSASPRSGLSQDAVGEIVRQKAEAMAERDRYREALDQIMLVYEREDLAAEEIVEIVGGIAAGALR